jgi:succinylglutamic semialdehyde dehydrogenase
VVWSGREATAADVERAVAGAQAAQPGWARTPLAERSSRLRVYGEIVRRDREALARAISRETGKPRWEARSEVDAVVAKVGLTLEAFAERAAETSVVVGTGTGCTRYRALGVVAVLGPFNLPAHLPNGHVVPALLAGNAVVLKPSEHTPLVAESMIRAWAEAGLPPGVLQLVQGGAAVGRALSGHPELDGVFFTGIYAVGRAIHAALAGRPETLLALEMGGNNPLVVWGAADVEAAAWIALLSAFSTAGQRCTCARRLVVAAGPAGDALLRVLVPRVRGIRVGRPDDRPEPFMGPLIDRRAARGLLAFQEDLVARGARVIVPMEPCGDCPALLRPGIVDVTDLAERPDEEHFGPLLQLIRVADFGAAIAEANRTRYGLAAGLVCPDPEAYRLFSDAVRAGVLAWNRPTTGASGRLPFGGLGRSGNHRPSGFRTIDYCGDPIASLEAGILAPPELSPGLAGETAGR